MFEIVIPNTDGEEAARAIVADRRVYVTEDRATLVEHEHPSARYLLAAPGHSIPAAEVARLGLVVVDGRVEQQAPESAGDAAVAAGGGTTKEKKGKKAKES